MSWIVQLLLNNAEFIKERSAYSEGEYKYFPLYDDKLTDQLTEDMYDKGYIDPKIESNEFNDLMVIERAIKEMRLSGLLEEDEISVLNGLYNTSKDRNKKNVFLKKFYLICDKIAEYLGGYYTDEGYLDYMKKEHGLSESQVETLRVYMKSEYKNKLMRKSLNE